jgi:hypothetical protein
VDIETWYQPRSLEPAADVFVDDDGGLLVLHTERMALAETLAAFDAIRDSLHLIPRR